MPVIVQALHGKLGEPGLDLVVAHDLPSAVRRLGGALKQVPSCLPILLQGKRPTSTTTSIV